MQAVYAWSYIECCVKQRIWQKVNLGDYQAKESIGAFVKFFSRDRNNSFLNTTYGPLSLPRRPFKPSETDPAQNVSARGDTRTIRSADSDTWNFLDPMKKYIWVIGDMGSIVIGEDIAVTADDDGEASTFQGHPTLLDGKPGRIAGELLSENSVWEINLKSRAYSGHIALQEQHRYLSAVFRLNLQGLKVEIQPRTDIISGSASPPTEPAFPPLR